MRLTIATLGAVSGETSSNPAADAGGPAGDQGNLSQKQIVAKDVHVSHLYENDAVLMVSTQSERRHLPSPEPSEKVWGNNRQLGSETSRRPDRIPDTDFLRFIIFSQGSCCA